MVGLRGYQGIGSLVKTIYKKRGHFESVPVAFSKKGFSTLYHISPWPPTPPMGAHRANAIYTRHSRQKGSRLLLGSLWFSPGSRSRLAAGDDRRETSWLLEALPTQAFSSTRTSHSACSSTSSNPEKVARPATVLCMHDGQPLYSHLCSSTTSFDVCTFPKFTSSMTKAGCSSWSSLGGCIVSHPRLREMLG